MTDTLMEIIGIFLAVLIMFIFPVVAIASQHDEIAQTTVETALADFVNTISEKGKVTQFDYNDLVQKITATGNSFDIQIELQVLDDNPERKTVTTDKTIKGENLYYSVYTENITSKIAEKINKGENGEYNLKKDDYIIVTVKNTNVTIGTQFKNMFYKIIGKDAYTISASSAALVSNSGDETIELGTPGGKTVYPKPINKDITIYITNTETISANVTFVIDCTGSMGDGPSSRMGMVRSSVKTFLQAIELPETSKPKNPIINVVCFGTTSQIMTNPGLNTRGEVNTFLTVGYESKLYSYNPAFQSYENYDLGFEDALKCIKRNKDINDNPNVVIYMTDGQKAFNSSYCITHNGNMSGYANKLIIEQGATVYAVGIGMQTSTDVLNSMVLNPSKYSIVVNDANGLMRILNEVKSEITTDEEKTVHSENGKIFLEDVTEISKANPLTLKITGPVNRTIEITSEFDSLISKDSRGYWLVLQSLAIRLGGLDILDEAKIEIHF